LTAGTEKYGSMPCHGSVGRAAWRPMLSLWPNVWDLW